MRAEVLETTMPRKLIKSWLPHHTKIREHKHLRVLGKRLHDPNLWHINRRSAAGAVSLSLFVAWLPIPGQMIVAGLAAVWLRLNLPLSVVGVWTTNPVTMPPMFYLAYELGALLLDEPVKDVDFELSFRWLAAQLDTVWQPFLLGCLMLGVVSALLGYGVVRVLWRIHVLQSWRKRKQRRLNRTGNEAGPPQPSS